jgi:hypothetical protein
MTSIIFFLANIMLTLLMTIVITGLFGILLILAFFKLCEFYLYSKEAIKAFFKKRFKKQ